MRKLTLALFHVEPCIEPTVPGSLNAAEMGYALGAVRFVEVHQGEKGAVARVRRATNTHFGPVPLLDDLLRPWVDVAVAYSARSLDLALAAAVWPSPSFHYANEEDVAGLTARLATAGLSVPVVSAEVPRGALAVGPATVAREVARRTVGHSELIPGSLVGLVPGGEALRAELRRRSFVVLDALHTTTGHPDLCDLEDWREGLSAAPAPGSPPAPAPGSPPAPRSEADAEIFARAYGAGRLWSAVHALHASLDQLEELVHAALYGGRRAALRTNRVRSDDGWVGACRVDDPHATFRYRIPTNHWWSDLETIARRG